MSLRKLILHYHKPQFSGHETFPLRYGWLKKAFDAVLQVESIAENKVVFLDDDAMVRFGVGKNMVIAIRYWATAAGIVRDVSSNRIEVTPLGVKIFSDDGLDPYMENPSTLWLVHWQLCSKPERTTWHWVFNYYSETNFDREDLVNGLLTLSHKLNWLRVSKATVKRDVECFVRTYAARLQSEKSIHEDMLESPLTELGLIRAVGKKDGFQLTTEASASLGNGIFAYTLVDFWMRFSKSTTLSFETLAHEPGSPGRTFHLDENELTSRLVAMDEVTSGAIQWSETAGLKQLIRRKDFNEMDLLSLLEFDYTIRSSKEATSQ